LGNLELGAKAFNSRRLTLDAWNSWPSDWTRDSKTVLFDSKRGGRHAILKQRIDQQTAEILLSGGESYNWPILSPTGERLLYTLSATAERDDPSVRLVSMPVGGGAPTVLLPGRYTYQCGSPASARCVLGEIKGQQLVFFLLDPIKGKGAEIQRVEARTDPYWALSFDTSEIAIVDAGSAGKIRILTLADRKVATLALQGWKWDQIQSVAWSANGSHLFATAWSDGSSVLLSVDLRGNLQVLSEAAADEWLWAPVASPDGHYLAYEKRTFESKVMMLEHF
jgi:Tol biopolymer transport system component